MEMPTFIYNVMPSKKREELINKRNVRVIKEFLKKREQMVTSRENDIAHIEKLHEDKSISTSTYRRLKQVLILTHEQKRIDLLKASVEKSVRISKPFVSDNNQESEDNHALVSSVENN